MSQLAEPLWTDPGMKSGISVRELIFALKKKKKKARAGNELPNILPKFSHARTKPPHSFITYVVSSDERSLVMHAELSTDCTGSAL